MFTPVDNSGILLQSHFLSLSVLRQHYMVFVHFCVVPIFAVVYGVVVEQPDEPFARHLIPQAEVEARFDLCIPRHSDEGKQDCDDGFLVHVLFDV